VRVPAVVEREVVRALAGDDQVAAAIEAAVERDALGVAAEPAEEADALDLEARLARIRRGAVAPNGPVLLRDEEGARIVVAGAALDPAADVEAPHARGEQALARGIETQLPLLHQALLPARAVVAGHEAVEASGARAAVERDALGKDPR